MILSTPTIKKTKDGVVYEVRITDSAYPDRIWYQVKERFGDFLSDTLDAALAALIIPAMHKGEDIILKGKVAESLLFHINNDVQTIYGVFHPHLKKITVHADEVYSEARQTANVATGFSGGVDTFYTMANHYYAENISPGFKITHLLYNNVGSHGGGGEGLCAERYHRLKLLPRRLDIPFIVVNTNLSGFYKYYSFIQTHTPRDASVGLVLQNGLGKYLYSSSINYHHLNIAPGKAITFSDSIILPKLSSPAIQLMSAGSATSRVEKIMQVADVPDSWEFLDVCVDEKNERNCSQCLKCMKTQLTLEIIGKLDRYNRVFDNKVYQKERTRFITSIHRSPSIHLNEILNLARERNYPLPFLKTKLYSLFRVYGILRRLSLGK